MFRINHRQITPVLNNAGGEAILCVGMGSVMVDGAPV